jgi:tetratricopeptide (TPR) repeat protein
MRAKPTAIPGIALLLMMGLTAGLAPAEARVGDVPETKTQLGSYLAGRVARSQHDSMAAATFYGKALEHDPGNELLVEQAFLMEATEGNWSRVEDLARQLLQLKPGSGLARAFLGLAAFKAARFHDAEEQFKATGPNSIGELTSALALAWTYQAQNKTNEAFAVLDAQRLPDWANYFLRFHRALIADVAGRPAEARASYERMTKNERALRVTLAYARHAAANGDARLAQSLLAANIERTKGDPHPYVRALQQEIAAGKPQLLVTTPAEGLAEAFYGLGEALSGEGSTGISVVFLQFALYLTPNAPFPLVTLANASETTKRYAAAIGAYERVPKGTPFEVNIEVRKALNLNQLERVDEAQKLLDQLANEYPQDLRPLEALGGIMRGHKRFDEAADYYSRAIALIGRPESKHWTYFYSRGTCYERLKKLSEAEADLQQALKLSPDQPLTLNYLGYTWIDHNRNLRQGLKMIEKAVRLKPDDGYIVDSLGWAHYRLGNFKDAVKYLERAVELRPEDATLNDHLGDAYWRVGRQREARFQWEQALSFKPEPEEIDKIRQKLEKGLPPSPAARSVKRKKGARHADRAKNRKRTEAAPLFPFFQ